MSVRTQRSKPKISTRWPPIISAPIIAKFKSKIALDEVTGCWNWTDPLCRGYGSFWDGRRGWPAHRYAYEAFVEILPNELTIDHLCVNRACVNVRHLEPVPMIINVQRRFSRTIPNWQSPEEVAASISQFDLFTKRCSRGHLLENGIEGCRLCRRDYERTKRKKLRLAVRLRRTSPEVAQARKVLERHTEEKFQRKIKPC